jgi:SAM-dependent methyltransferase
MGFEWAYRDGSAPWDIGRPQPVFVRLAEEGAISGSVLDVGCGTGENALFLASRGAEVLGVDAAPTAIARASRKASQRGLDADFVVADALDLAALDRTFDVAIDCGLFHVFSDEDRHRYERSLHAVLRAGGRYLVLCFSDEQPGVAGPRRVSQAEIRATFAAGWRVESIVPANFDTLDTTGELRAPRAWLASITRLGAAESDRPESAASSVEAAGPARSGPGAR